MVANRAFLKKIANFTEQELYDCLESLVPYNAQTWSSGLLPGQLTLANAARNMSQRYALLIF